MAASNFFSVSGVYYIEISKNIFKMKKLLFTFVAIFFAFIGNAQNACNASFTWSQTPTNFYPYQVSVTNTSTYAGAPVYSYAYYNMSWGDGTTSGIYGSGVSTHNYSNAGPHTATLYMTVVDSLNPNTPYCTDTFTTTITTIVAPCNTVINTTNNGGGSYTFTANNAGGALTYSWDLGDGSTAGNSASVTHTYANAGTYTITLTITGGGTTCTSSTNISYQNGVVNCANLIASFNSNTQNGLTVYFSNTSTTSFNTNPSLTRVPHWNFGDGGTSALMNPSHTYISAGTYTVQLINQWVDSTNPSSVYCTDTIHQTITVSSTAANYITGGIYWDSTLNISTSSFKVWLITFDTATNIIDAIDSVTTSGINGQVAYTFHNLPAGIYRTKAAVVNGVPGATVMAPTYHTSSTYWGNATLINHGGSITNYKNIFMQAGNSTSGPGFIAGNVTMGAGKGTAIGAPNLLILLRDASNQMVKFTYTDANGDYSFSSIPLGTYNIYPENMPQVTTPSSSMTISSGNTTFNGIDFVKNSVKIVPKNLALNDVKVSICSVHPNPAKDIVTITWNSNVSGNVNISMVDIAGRILLQTTATTTAATSINIGQIPAGMYFLKMATDHSQETEKLIIQK